MTASNFINALGNIGSFGLNFASGTSVSKTNEINKYMSYLWRKNYKWSNLNGYSYMRQGLENAGYNPLLAIGASPQQGYGSSAVAAGDSIGINADIASGKQANVARDMAGSQIDLNQANAFKSFEEAKSQDNYRQNLDSQTALNNIKTIWESESIPVRLKLLLTEIETQRYTQANLSSNTAKTTEDTKYVGKYADIAQQNANTAERDSKTNRGKAIAAGILTGLGLFGIGAGVNKIKNIKQVGDLIKVVPKYINLH